MLPQNPILVQSSAERRSRGLQCNELRALIQNQRAVEVLAVVDAVLDLFPVPVELPLLRAVSFHVPVDVNLDHLVGRQEAIADALLE